MDAQVKFRVDASTPQSAMKFPVADSYAFNETAGDAGITISGTARDMPSGTTVGLRIVEVSVQRSSDSFWWKATTPKQWVPTRPDSQSGGDR